jgi:hypothetical protein
MRRIFLKTCEFPKMVRNNLPPERFLSPSMVELLILHADCSLVTSKPAHLSPYLPEAWGYRDPNTQKGTSPFWTKVAHGMRNEIITDRQCL